MGDNLPFDRDSARHIIARLDGSIESIKNRTVTKKLKDLKEQLKNVLEGKESKLLFPKITAHPE